MMVFNRGDLESCLSDYDELSADEFERKWSNLLSRLCDRYKVREYMPEFDPTELLQRAMEDV